LEQINFFHFPAGFGFAGPVFIEENKDWWKLLTL